MKAVLLITLLAICSCAEPIEIVKCFLKSDVIFKALAELIEIIKEKDMTKIVSFIIQYYGPFYEEIKKCLNPETETLLLAAEEPEYPAWLERLFPKLGRDNVLGAYKYGKGPAVKQLCWSRLGADNKLCKSIFC